VRCSGRAAILINLVAAGVLAAITAGCEPDGGSSGSAARAARANGVDLAARGYRRYDLERAVVHYRITGDEEAAETLYFDHWGMREARLRQPVGTAGTTLILIDGDATFVVDVAAKRATVQATRHVPGTAMPLTHLGKRRRAWFESLGGKAVGRGRIAGRSCERWETPVLGTTVCLWKFLPLAAETRVDGTHRRRIAVQVDVDPQIPPERFTLPPGIAVGQGD
jgi:hypothetical protein